jgi:hypothetical protein
MPKSFWIGLTLVILMLSGASIYFGFRPKPIVVVRPSNIENLETLGATAYRQLRAKWKETKWVVVGVPPSEIIPHRMVVDFLNGFAEQAAKDQWAVETILDMHTGLDTSGFKFKPKVESMQSPESLKSMTLGLSAGGTAAFPERRIILLSSVDAIHRPASAVTSIVEPSLKTIVPSILFLRAGQQKDEPIALLEPCDLTEERQQILSQNLGCYAKRQTLTFALSRKTDLEKPLVSIELASSYDVVVYLGSIFR